MVVLGAAGWALTLFMSLQFIPGENRSRLALSLFEKDAPVGGRILENSTACEGDLDCYLHVEFADTSVFAVYGLGFRVLALDREEARCFQAPRDAVAGAGDLQPGDFVSVIISECRMGEHEEELVIKQLAPPSG